MEITRITPWLLAFLGMTLFQCDHKPQGAGTNLTYESQAFRDYWHAGKAEVSSYDLQQSRYGETRGGKAVLIFVTEDLSKKLQVKLDDPSGRNKINVLKLNFTKSFITGI